jgi:hypothetical protein
MPPKPAPLAVEHVVPYDLRRFAYPAKHNNIEVEEADILAAFFDWKIANTKNIDRKTK